MTAELFPNVLEHIQENLNCTPENPILLTLHNHSSHVSYPTIEYCKNNGIVLLSLPPHCTHRMQPLDVAIFSPFKSSMRNAMKHHIESSKRLTAVNVQSLPFLSTAPFNHAFSRSNIISAFNSAGIWPLDKDKFSSFDYHEMTEEQNHEPVEQTTTPRISPNTSELENNNSSRLETSVCNETSNSFKSARTPLSTVNPNISPKDAVNPDISPQDIRPYPKIQTATSTNNRKSRKKKSTILTASPEVAEAKRKFLEQRKTVKKSKTTSGKKLATSKKSATSKRLNFGRSRCSRSSVFMQKKVKKVSAILEKK